jgi:hypothetical protein
LQTAGQATTLAATNRTFFLTTRATARQKKMLLLLVDQLDGDFRILGQVMPAATVQLTLELGQLATPGCEHIFPAGLLDCTFRDLLP